MVCSARVSDFLPAKESVNECVLKNLSYSYIPLPKSDSPHRIAENIDVFNFELSPQQMHELDELGKEGDLPVCKSYDDFCD